MENNLYKNKVVLITGATGLIGSHLVRKLLDLEAEVIAVGRKYRKLEDIFKNEVNNKKLKLIEINISQQLPQNIGIVDYIFHAASPISGKDIVSKPIDVITSNLMGVKNCLDYLRLQKKERNVNGKLVVFSSATVYGDVYEVDCNYSEKDTYHAPKLDSLEAYYSETKRMMEIIAKGYYVQYGVDIVIARISYVYGYTKYMPNTAFYEFIKNGVQAKDIVINNANIKKRDNIYVDDVIDGLILIANKGKVGEAYNISSNGEKNNYSSIDKIARVIAKCSNEVLKNNKITVKIPEAEAVICPGIRLNNKKIEELGWTVKTSLEEGIKKTIGLYLTQQREECRDEIME